ncbi:phosphopantothenoylcysteine decarboxylase isoform X3 [Gymnodraco acuticeps]|uniref:Phosphopantothenoylcysteine decarboxylase isoform X3 n=1 Tax=Gymnodraco acuticeps TaxID=8218 RepID=A0A6P8TA83_GYMAC|nr:phosphopantothenoylcysteine decarboxylase isoform X3 [Pseudochaenichthys georgianus]XP_034060729.1 phosphopantothenoylcysteine decarboxylase isoform X3 [Gymnodraco acuticeps]
MQTEEHDSGLKAGLLKSCGTCRVLVGVTGSVAALKLPVLVSQLLQLSGTCVVRAWDTSRPLLFCPAMNTAMWQHPITAQQVSRLTEFGYVEIPCIAKKLVCGDEGKGAMAEVSTIVSVVKQYLPIPDESSQKTSM